MNGNSDFVSISCSIFLPIFFLQKNEKEKEEKKENLRKGSEKDGIQSDRKSGRCSRTDCAAN
jgi:hypothetical protein